jgi:hydroxymethylbilane synthase
MRQNDSLRELVSQMNHVPTWQSVTAERSFLYALGGVCRAPIAALGKVSGESLKLEGMVASVRQNKILAAAIEGSVVEANGLGKSLADRLIEMGAADFIAEAERIGREKSTWWEPDRATLA